MTKTPTSQRLEVVRRFWEAFRGPLTPEVLETGYADSLLEDFYTPDAVFDLTGVTAWPDVPVFEGREGIRRFWQLWFGQWERVSWELEHVEPIADQVVSVAAQRGLGASSQTPVEWRLAFLSTHRGAKMERVRFFESLEDAREAASA